MTVDYRGERRDAVLVLAPGCPPMPRLLKLLKHLPAEGWRPLLLAPRRPGSGDHRFQSTYEHEVIETLFLPSPVDWLRRLRQRGRPSPVPGRGRVHPGRSHVIPSLERWRFGRKALLWATTPDELVGWLPWALRRGRRVVRRERVKAILATGPPFSVVLAGVLLKRTTGLPLVADFRDAWLLDPVDPFGTVGGWFEAPHSAMRRAVLARLERAALASSDHVLFTSDATAEAYRREYPSLEGRLTVLYNGAEASDFEAAADTSCPFALTYVGTLHEFQRGQVGLVLAGYAAALAANPRFGRSRLRLYGHRPPAMDRFIQGIISEHGIGDHVTVGGVIAHEKTAALLKSRGLLLVLAGQSRLMRPSKISDCLAAGRPILALAAQDSETARHVTSAGQYNYSGGDAHELGRMILRLWETHRHDDAESAPFPFPETHQLNWRASSRELSRILERVSQAV